MVEGMSVLYAIGNWKMNPGSLREAEKLLSAISKDLPSAKDVTTVLCPPFPFLQPLKKNTKSRKVLFGAQDVFWERAGSFTGEVSVSMLEELGARFVIVGHSERRQLGETSGTVNRKIHAVLRSSMRPVLCIGERERDQEGQFLAELKQQLAESLAGVSRQQLEQILIAYEPVWAVGGDHAIDPSEMHQAKILIQKYLSDMHDTRIAEEVGILYGGAVNPDNITAIMKEGHVSGVLVGRSSREPKEFSAIAHAVAEFSTHEDAESL